MLVTFTVAVAMTIAVVVTGCGWGLGGIKDYDNYCNYG
jgi:hypothetical protein